MEPRARRSPYIHVSTLARYLGDPDACGYAAHYKAHFQYRRPAPLNPQWLLDHAGLVHERAAALRAEGYTVTVEEANDLRLVGAKTGTIVAGRPDILALNVVARRGIIEECKTGVPRSTDAAQARLYLLLIPHAQKALTGFSLAAQVSYPDSSPVPVLPVDEQFRALFRTAVALVGSTQPPPTVPSIHACRFCDVPACASRVKAADLDVMADSSLFSWSTRHLAR